MKCKCNLPSNLDDLDLFNLPMDCEGTWDLIRQGKVKGCFQIESNLGQHWSKKISPDNIDHLSAIIALVRPGTLEAYHEGKNMPTHYTERKHGIAPSTPIHPQLEDILQDTFQVVTYQEQIMKIATKLANFDLKEADWLRSSLAKKLPEEVAKVKVLFLSKAKGHGLITEEEAKTIFDIIEKSQRYSFNRCFSGDTYIFKNCNKYQQKFSLREVYKLSQSRDYAKSINKVPTHAKYKLKKYGKCLSIMENRLKENNIVDVRFEGEQDVYLLTSENGHTVKCTNNHKFPTPNGEFELSNLKIGDELYYRGEYEKSNGKKYGFSDLPQQGLGKKYGSHCGFRKGKDNPAYTNGAYALWEENKKKLPLECAKCGKKEGRLEVHHKNGDRTDSSLENLERLCVSCHKKEEYANGRVKRGEKGYPILTTKIKSIEYIGKEDVYDVEMAAPYHTLTLDNGLITCNSHSYSYANYSYISAYIKYHFPLEFFCSWLTFAGDKPNPKLETKQLIQDAKTFDININVPYLPDLEPHCYIASENEKLIRFGLVDLAGIGESSFNKLIKLFSDKKDTIKDLSFIDFLLQFGEHIDQTTFKALIASGSIDYLKGKLSRQAKLYIYDKYLKLTEKEIRWISSYRNNNKEEIPSVDQIKEFSYILSRLAPTKKEGGGTHSENRSEVVRNLIKLIDNPPYSLDDSVDWLIEQEETLLGIALTASRLTASELNIHPNTTCREFADGQNCNRFVLAANIDSTRVIKTKKGKQAGSDMAFISLSDDSGAIDGVAFPDCWKENGRLLAEGRSVIVMGKRDAQRNSFMIEKVWSL